MGSLHREAPAIHATLARLRAESHTDIDHLKGGAKKDFEFVQQYVHILYQTKMYPEFHTMIRHYFADLDPSPDNSIGKYFAGCISAEKKGTGSCDPACMGSVPTPNTVPCDKNVYLCAFRDPDYSFIPINQGKDDVAILVVPEFVGFTTAEKSYLKSQGINKVNLYDYSYVAHPITQQGPVDVDVLPLREIKRENEKLKETRENTLIVLLCLITLFLLVVLGIMWYKSR